jgi:hypothetical protein
MRVTVACDTAMCRASVLVDGLPSFPMASITSSCGVVSPDSRASFCELISVARMILRDEIRISSYSFIETGHI